MIASWMTSTVFFGVLMAVAALAAEQALRALGRQGRWPLIAGLVASVAGPAIAPLFTNPVTFAAPVVIGGSSVTPARAIARQLAGFAGGSSRVDLALVALWVIASAVVFARLIFTAHALRRLRRGAHRTSLDGVSVLVTPDAGPAVLGFARADVLIPSWLADFDASLRAPALAESNHHLHRRIDAMTDVPKRAAARATLACAVTLGVLVLACSPRVTGDLMSPKPQTVETLAPQVVSSDSAAAATAAEGAVQPTRAPASADALTRAAAPTRVTPKTVDEKAGYREFQVEKPATFAPGSAQPRYPDILKAAGVSGEVVIMVVIDEHGMADPRSMKVVKGTHQLFVDAVKNALPNFRFSPAMVGGRPVRQLLRLPFVFAIAEPDTHATPPAGDAALVVTGVKP